jgi:hypothetical protein
MSELVVFAGPTIDAAQVCGVLGGDAVVLGPARQGDVMRARRLGARVIAVIDGYFQSVPAVWHKEILWAMADGAHVVGAASMGALRAAELHSFGMVGVGRIFEWFRDGVLVRDDEVAVAHASAEAGYRTLSEAMVNIRATVAAAVDAGALDHSEAGAVLADAAARFYPDRHWAGLRDGVAERAGAAAAARLDDFVRNGGRVDQKRADASALLELLRDGGDAWSTPKSVTFSLARTVWFDHLHRHAGTFSGAEGAAVAVGEADLDDELRLHRQFRPALRATLLRHLTGEEARRRGLRVGPEQVADYANDVCHDLGLVDQASFEAWLDRNGLTTAAFNELMELELQRSMVMTEISRPARAALPDGLRLAGLWPAVTARAARKVRLLEDAGLADPGLEATGLRSHDELVDWWLDRVGEGGHRSPYDLDALAAAADYPDRHQFLQALLREYCASMLGLEPLEGGGRRW